jgi:asparagine synthase (glutamine-hydrolysing)
VSAIGGIYSRSGSPLLPGFVDRLSESLAIMGPDGESRHSATSFAMLFRPLSTDGDSSPEEQSCFHSDNYVLAWDGRLDNAEELRLRLDSRTQGRDRYLDIVLAMYREFGIAAFSRFVGDFAFSLWDPINKTMILACDGLGRRPLYVLSTPQYVTWASRGRALLHAWQGEPEIDEEYVADFLSNRPSTHSPYKSIQQILGGEALVIAGDRLRLETYWSITPNQSIHYDSDQEYEQHFRDIFFESVRCRLPKKEPVFCELSGGVDSSSIACVADLVSRNSRTAEGEVITASFVFNHSASSDEREYIETVEERLGKKGLYLDEDDCPILEPLPATLRPDCPTNALLFFSRYNRIAMEMQSCGARVLLNGIGGDQLFWSEPPLILPLPDLLLKGNVASFLRNAWECSKFSGWPYLKTVWRSLRPFLLDGRLVEDDEYVDPPGNWFLPEFVKRAQFHERARSMKDNLGFRLPSSATQYSIWRRTMRTFALEPCPDTYYVDIRYPYLDRRLVEFALAIPLEQKVRLPETRSIVRRGLCGILPDAVRLRKTKSGPDEAFHRAVIREGSRLMKWCSDLRVSARGFVDPVRFAEAIRLVRHGMSENSTQLMRTMSLELWLRSLEYSEKGCSACKEVMNSPLVPQS